MCAHLYDISGTIHDMTVIIISCMVPEILSVTDRILCHFGHLLPIYPLKTRKIKILEKKKMPGDIILHKCTKNQDLAILFLRYSV